MLGIRPLHSLGSVLILLLYTYAFHSTCGLCTFSGYSPTSSPFRASCKPWYGGVCAPPILTLKASTDEFRTLGKYQPLGTSIGKCNSLAKFPYFPFTYASGSNFGDGTGPRAIIPGNHEHPVSLVDDEVLGPTGRKNVYLYTVFFKSVILNGFLDLLGIALIRDAPQMERVIEATFHEFANLLVDLELSDPISEFQYLPSIYKVYKHSLERLQAEREAVKDESLTGELRDQLDHVPRRWDESRIFSLLSNSKTVRNFWKALALRLNYELCFKYLDPAILWISGKIHNFFAPTSKIEEFFSHRLSSSYNDIFSVIYGNWMLRMTEQCQASFLESLHRQKLTEFYNRSGLMLSATQSFSTELRHLRDLLLNEFKYSALNSVVNIGASKDTSSRNTALWACGKFLSNIETAWENRMSEGYSSIEALKIIKRAFDAVYRARLIITIFLQVFVGILRYFLATLQAYQLRKTAELQDLYQPRLPIM